MMMMIYYFVIVSKYDFIFKIASRLVRNFTVQAADKMCIKSKQLPKIRFRYIERRKQTFCAKDTDGNNRTKVCMRASVCLSVQLYYPKLLKWMNDWWWNFSFFASSYSFFYSKTKQNKRKKINYQFHRSWISRSLRLKPQ